MLSAPLLAVLRVESTACGRRDDAGRCGRSASAPNAWHTSGDRPGSFRVRCARSWSARGLPSACRRSRTTSAEAGYSAASSWRESTTSVAGVGIEPTPPGYEPGVVPLDQPAATVYHVSYSASIEPDVNLTDWLILCETAPDCSRGRLWGRKYAASSGAPAFYDFRGRPRFLRISSSRTVSGG